MDMTRREISNLLPTGQLFSHPLASPLGTVFAFGVARGREERSHWHRGSELNFG
jgi:hypothetical protein